MTKTTCRWWLRAATVATFAIGTAACATTGRAPDRGRLAVLIPARESASVQRRARAAGGVAEGDRAARTCVGHRRDADESRRAPARWPAHPGTPQEHPGPLHEIRKRFDSPHVDDPQGWPEAFAFISRVATARFWRCARLARDAGLIVAGSHRADFPGGQKDC